MQDNQGKKGLSSGAKWGIGCGSGCLVVVVVLAVAGIVVYAFIKRQVGDWKEEFAALGFEHVETGQQVTVSQPVTIPTLYLAQGVKITSEVATNVAIIAQMAEVYGRVDGDLYFRGQMLMIGPEAVIEGDVDLAAQSVVLEGEVKGEVRGTYQSLQGE